MAVILSVYGKADMKQIQRAEKQLASLKKEATAGSGAFKRWGGVMQKASAGAAIGFASVSGVIAKGVFEYNKLGSATSALTKLTNISAEAASTFSGQWSRFGVDAVAGQRGLIMLSKQIESAKGGTKASSEAFAKLGITISDLSTMTGGEIMAKVRDQMSQMTDKTERATLMMKLFGKGGMAMLKWLDATPASIAKVNSALKEQGSIMSESDLADYKKSAAAQADLSQAWRGFLQQAGKSVIPELTSMVGMFTKLQRAAAPLAGSLKYIALGLGAFAVGAKIASGFNTINTALKTMKGLLAGGKLAGGLADLAGAGGGAGTFVKTKGGQTVAGSLIPAAGGAGGAGGLAAGAGTATLPLWVTIGAIAAPAAALIGFSVALATYKENAKSPSGFTVSGGGGGGPAGAGAAGRGNVESGMKWRLQQEAKSVRLAVDAAVKELSIKASTQTGAAFIGTLKQIAQLRELAAKKIPLGNIDKEHTDAELRTTRDRIATSLGITIKEADALMKTMFKDWRPQDVLMPAINQAAAATEKRIAQLRREAAKDIRMGGVNAEKLLNEIGKVTSAFSGMRDQARQAANAAANALQRRRGLQGGGHIDKGGGFQMASGGWVAPRPGGLAVVLAEGGEGEYVVPESKVGRFAQAALGGGAAPAAPTHATVIERHVTLTWQTLTGEPSTREKQRLAAWLKPELDGMGARVTGTGF